MPITGQQDFLHRAKILEMDEKVERPAENTSVYRQDGSRPQAMTNEAFLQSGQGIACESNFIPSNLSPLIFNKPNGGMRIANYSLQTGEEFALEFSQEASRTQKGSRFGKVPVLKGNFPEANPYVYEDITCILGIGRTDSGSNSEISTWGTDKFNLSDFGSNLNPAYAESVQEMQTSRYDDDGMYQLDGGLVAHSSRQTRLQQMSSYSTYQSYLSGTSNDSPSGKVKFMCSFGGTILPRPSDGKLRYVGGETRIISVNKDISYEELMHKIKDIYGLALILKYQLPGEDLDALVSVSSEEDLDNMMEEYEKLEGSDGSSRLRIFLFTAVDHDLAHFDALVDRRNSKQLYVHAVNGISEINFRKHSDSMGSMPLQHSENLIGLDVTENQSITRRAQEGCLDTLLPQFSKDGAKIANLPCIPHFSKPPISTASFATKSPALSPPSSTLPVHVQQSEVTDTSIHILPERGSQVDRQSYCTVNPPEGYRVTDYGTSVSSSGAFDHELPYKHTTARKSLDLPINQHHDALLPSHPDSMYQGDQQLTDTNLPRFDSHGKPSRLQEQFETAQPTLDLRSDGLHPMGLEQVAQISPPMHQPMWQHHLDADQYSYMPPDYIPIKSGVHVQQPVLRQTMHTIHHNLSQIASHDSADHRYVDPAQLSQDDGFGDSYIENSVLTNQSDRGSLKQGDSSPSLCQSGEGQQHAQVQQAHNASDLDQEHSDPRVQNYNDLTSRAFLSSTSHHFSEQLPEDVVYQQTLPHEKVSHLEEQFACQQTIPKEQVPHLDEQSIHHQALPHVLSDPVLQTRIMKSSHPMCEGIPFSQGHRSDSSLRIMPPYSGSNPSQIRFMPFQDQQDMGDAKSQTVHQGNIDPSIFSGLPGDTVKQGSGENLEEQPSLNSRFYERSDETDRVVQKTTLDQDDKIYPAKRTSVNQSGGNDDEQITEFSGSYNANLAGSFGGIERSVNMNIFLPPSLGDSHQAYQKTEKLETFVATPCQLKLHITSGEKEATGILTDAMQALQLSGRMNQMSMPRSDPIALEGGSANLLEQYATLNHDGDVHIKLPTVDQRVMGEKLPETASNSYLSTAGFEQCIPLSTSKTWRGETGSDRSCNKVEASIYAFGKTGNLADDLSHDPLPLMVNNDMGMSQYHAAQYFGKSLIDHDIMPPSYPVSGILSSSNFVDEFACSTSVALLVSTEEDGSYHKADSSNHGISKGLFQETANPKTGTGHLDENSSKDSSMHLNAVEAPFSHVNVQDHLDMRSKGESQSVAEGMPTSEHLNIHLDSTLAESDWEQVSEVRVEESILLGKVTEVVDEESMTIQYSDTEEAKIEDSDKDEPVSDAVIAEAEAIAHGLQIIKNADLEELRELGSGTFGTVFHGKWRGSDVAIKRIKNSCFMGRESEQERMRADFWREAHLLAHLHHPNVVAFYGVVPDGPGGTLATVTEYMVNGSLKQVLQKKDRTIDRRKRWFIAMDAAFGMEYLHGKNIVHFDLKCENLLVNMRDPQRPICKVGDLGLSKIKHKTLVSGGVRGTLPWMAPELLNGSTSMVSEKVDVFSFGIVMWELLTGEEPYANMHYGAIIGGIVSNTLRPPVPSWCDPAWRSLMEQCWSADPAARPSFTEIAGRLRATATSFHVKGHRHNAHIHHR